MSSEVFISYGHADQQPMNWLGRLSQYLAQARQEGVVDAWHDGRIQAGTDWAQAIERALHTARASILLVGPAFLSSPFIRDNELPPLLVAARQRGMRLFPLVTSYCDYARSSLGNLQAFNDFNQPLEALPLPEQNRILNDLSIAVSSAVDRDARHEPATSSGASTLLGAMKQLVEWMDVSDKAFTTQNTRCRSLVFRVAERLNVEKDEFEKFLFRYFPSMTNEEVFEFRQIRAVTEGPLAESNRKMLDILLNHPRLLDEIPDLTSLRQHLVFWLNKFDRIFTRTEAMAVCYVGVEDGVPWPGHAEAAVRNWLLAHST